MTFLQDLQYAVRMMRRAPWFTAAVIGMLALGLGLNSAVLSLANALFLKGLPFENGSPGRGAAHGCGTHRAG